jgi:hypothetical protein
MKPLSVKTTDCSYKDIYNICRKCGFIVFDGAKHYKVKTGDGKFVTMFPKSVRIKRETARGIFAKLQEFNANIVIIK